MVYPSLNQNHEDEFSSESGDEYTGPIKAKLYSLRNENNNLREKLKNSDEDLISLNARNSITVKSSLENHSLLSQYFQRETEYQNQIKFLNASIKEKDSLLARQDIKCKFLTNLSPQSGRFLQYIEVV